MQMERDKANPEKRRQMQMESYKANPEKRKQKQRDFHNDPKNRETKRSKQKIYNLRIKNVEFQKRFMNFKNDTKDGPVFVCLCCRRTLFKNGVKIFCSSESSGQDSQLSSEAISEQESRPSLTICFISMCIIQELIYLMIFLNVHLNFPMTKK